MTTCLSILISVSFMVLTIPVNLSFQEDLPNDPIIVWWSSPFQRDLHPLDCGSALPPGQTCFLTSNRKYKKFSQTRAFLFYGSDFDPRDVPLPRAPTHLWALVHEESPMNNYALVHRPLLELFNYTSTFRRESDMPLTTFSLESLEYLTERQPVSTEQKNYFQNHEGFAPILYVQSHCNVASDRDRYVKELMKYIPIDSYGSCVQNRKLPKNLTDPVESMHSSEFLALIANYKFHLSIENAICDDYMTEKLFRPMHVGSVIIYKGAPTVRDWLPSDNSAILIDDFSTPKELAEYVLALNQDDDAYNQMLLYKTEGIQNQFLIEHMATRSYGPGPQNNFIDNFQCNVCKDVLENYQNEIQGKPAKTKTASLKHLQCPQPYVSLGTLKDLTDTDEWPNIWIDDYWTGLDKALALEKMLQENNTDSSNFDKYFQKVMWENPHPTYH